MGEKTDIVERLRKQHRDAEFDVEASNYVDCDLWGEAADKIERERAQLKACRRLNLELQDEIERLRDKVDNLGLAVGLYKVMLDKGQEKPTEAP
jgi:hypothetical protein